MKKVNSIAMDVKKYKNKEEFYAALGKTITNLLELDQIILTRYEDAGIYIIEFMPNVPEFGDYMPVWLLPEEEEQIIFSEERN